MSYRLYIIVNFLAVIILSSCKSSNIVKYVVYVALDPFLSSHSRKISDKQQALYYGILFFISDENNSYNLYSRSLESVYQTGSNPSHPHYAIPNYLYEIKENVSPEQLRKLFDDNDCLYLGLISNIQLPKDFITKLQMTHKGYYYTIEQCTKQELLREMYISNKEIEFSSSIAVNKYRKSTESPKPSDFIKNISMTKKPYYYIISRHSQPKEHLQIIAKVRQKTCCNA